MNPDTVSRRRRWSTRTARHGACIGQQPARRQSLAQVTRLANRSKRRAGLGRPSVAGSGRAQWFRSTRSASCLAVVSFSCAQAGAGFTPGTGKANDALPAPGLITPHPPQGGFGLFITHKYARNNPVNAWVNKIDRIESTGQKEIDLL